MKKQKGKIISFEGDLASNVAYLLIENEDGEQEFIPCDSVSTARALEKCFGGVILPDQTVSQDAIEGKSIHFFVDEFGVLTKFEPVEE